MWGCGVFNGDKVLKFLIQWIAASVVGRKLVFFTLLDIEFRKIKKLVKAIENKTAGELFELIIAYSKMKAKLSSMENSLELVDFLLNAVS